MFKFKKMKKLFLIPFLLVNIVFAQEDVLIKFNTKSALEKLKLKNYEVSEIKMILELTK